MAFDQVFCHQKIYKADWEKIVGDFEVLVSR